MVADPRSETGANMKSNPALATLARWVFGILAGLGFLVSSAVAGDRALANFIGFSPDTRYFAFEEFGIESDSGLAYSRIYFIDLASDTWLADTPVSATAEEGDKSENLAAVRAQTSRKAESLLARHDIVVPAEIASLNGDGAPYRDPMRLGLLYPIPAWGAATKAYSLIVTSFPATSTTSCPIETDGVPQGYELRLAGKTGEIVLHRDEGLLPSSRGCPRDYGLYAVVIPGVGARNDAGVAIVSYYQSAYEGPSRRFLAVPFSP